MDYRIFLKNLGIKLKLQRKRLGITQSELVEKINKGIAKNEDNYLSDKQMSRVECGENATRLDKFVRWSLALGKTPDYFLLGIDYGDNSKDDKILQISACLKECKENDVDIVLMLVQSMNQQNRVDR